MVLKDLTYNVELVDMTATLITDVIKGYLEAVIFESDKQVRFDAVLNEIQDITIWTERNINGKHFLIIRHECMKNSNNRYNYQYEKFPLLNRLKFFFRGQKGTHIKITVRYSDAG